MLTNIFACVAFLFGDYGGTGVSIVFFNRLYVSEFLSSIPKHESGEIEVFSSTQAVTDCQRWVAQVSHNHNLSGGIFIFMCRLPVYLEIVSLRGANVWVAALVVKSLGPRM